MRVIDATVAFAACARADGFDEFGARPLAAPPLMWSEARSAVHEVAWRGEIEREMRNAPSTRRSTIAAFSRQRRLGDRRTGGGSTGAESGEGPATSGRTAA